MRLIPICAFWLFLAALAGCGSRPEQAPAPVRKKPAVTDDTHRFPAANRVDAKVVQDHVFEHNFLPGGNVAHYRRGKQEFDLLLIRTPAPESAALLLVDYKNHLEGPKFVAHFGGFSGFDGGRTAFLFAKGIWLCGVIGLPEHDADMTAREFAARVY